MTGDSPSIATTGECPFLFRIFFLVDPLTELDALDAGVVADRAVGNVAMLSHLPGVVARDLISASALEIRFGIFHSTGPVTRLGTK
jgi:hypothetical protein